MMSIKNFAPLSLFFVSAVANQSDVMNEILEEVDNMKDAQASMMSKARRRYYGEFADAPEYGFEIASSDFGEIMHMIEDLEKHEQKITAQELMNIFSESEMNLSYHRDTNRISNLDRPTYTRAKTDISESIGNKDVQIKEIEVETPSTPEVYAEKEPRYEQLYDIGVGVYMTENDMHELVEAYAAQWGLTKKQLFVAAFGDCYHDNCDRNLYA